MRKSVRTSVNPNLFSQRFDSADVKNKFIVFNKNDI